MADEKSSSFAAQYLDRVGFNLDLFERASQGKLPDTITLDELTKLIGNETAVMLALRAAAESGALVVRAAPNLTDTTRIFHKNGTIRREPPAQTFIIHRDDARRYFRSLGLKPEPHSALWCWLTGGQSESSHDEGDYRQALAEIWKVSPMTRIGAFNDGHILDQVAGFNHIPQKRRKELAKEVARDHADPSVLRTGATPGKRT